MAAINLSDELMALDLPMRVYNAFWRYDIRTVGQVVELTDVDVMCMRNLGSGSVADVKRVLSAHGLALAEPGPGHVPWYRRRQATAAPVVAPGSMTGISALPEPGLERARWLGDRITELTGAQSRSLVPHAKRRAAARKALARIDGYEPERADDDALYLTCASIHLAGLNEYARRVLDEGQPTIEEDGADHAVL